MNQLCTCEVLPENLFQPNQPDLFNNIDTPETINEDYSDDEVESDEYYDNYEEDEEEGEEEYPRVYYNLKAQPKQDNTKEIEAVKQRYESIQQKKLEKQVTQQILNVKDILPHQSISLEKVKTLAPYSGGVKGCCYVPERNLIFIILQESKTVVIYSSLSFKEIKRLKFTKQMRVIKYSKQYERVIIGGEDFCVETFNLNTLKMEFQSDFVRGWHVDEVSYLKKHNAIAVATNNGYLRVLSKSLVSMYQINLGNYGTARDLIRLGTNFVLVALEYNNIKNLFLCNLKTQKAQLCNNIAVSPTSCIEITKGPVKTVTCYAKVMERNHNNYGLVQLAVDTKTGKLIVHKIDSEANSYCYLRRVSNSDYFIASSYIQKDILIKISGDEVQPVKAIITKDCNMNCAQAGMFTWLDQVPTIIGPDSQGRISVYKVNIDKEKKALEN